MGKMDKNRDSAVQMMQKQMALMEKDMNCDKKNSIVCASRKPYIWGLNIICFSAKSTR